MSFLRPAPGVAREGIGKPVPRQEDGRLLSGAGCFADDVAVPGQAWACMVRSPHAHARILAIDARGALRMPGILAVLSGEDAARDGLQPIPFTPISANPHEVRLTPLFLAPCPVLPVDKARFAGQAVAMVVAQTLAQAKDAAEQVAVDYEALPSLTSAGDALADGAQRVWEACESNLSVDCAAGDAAAVTAAFACAAHIVRLDTQVNRVTGVPMEPRSALASYDPATGRYTVHASSGAVQRHRNDIAAVLGVSAQAVRVVTRDLGGNYGTRNNLYPEYALVAWAARRAGRPVKWTCERSEAFLSDEHARGLACSAELALDAEGRFLALRCVNDSDVGAHSVSYVPLAKGIGVSTSLYRIAAAAVRGRAVFTSTSPTTSYRAAGRPEVMYVIERLIDIAARRHGFDRVALREINLPQPAQMPNRNPFGLVYDIGDYPGAQRRALLLADWAGFGARRTEARLRGRLRGIGVANYIELNTGVPQERAEVHVLPPGRIEVVIGTLSSGQGHETSFAQLLAEWLGVELAQVRLLTGDSDVAKTGGGSHSGRSMRMAAVVIANAADRIVEQGRQRAAERLEAAATDIEFARGRFTLQGTDRSLGLFELGPLSAGFEESTPLPSYPYGCAVCEVEIDPETGEVEVVRHANVDDCGRAVNPLILHGQTHGGIAAGIGQALWEECHYEPASGQLLSGSFMDYALPRAGMLPSFDTEISEVPSTTHPLGMRGGGEGGTTPALAAVTNAIVDALAEFGVEHVEMPATPERVWRALSGRPARASAAVSLRPR